LCLQTTPNFQMQDFILYTCAYLDVMSKTITSVEKLHKTDHTFDWWFVTGDALIARARSVAAYRFLTRSDAPYMIFLDADIVFEPEDVTKILDELKSGKDVIAGLYAMQGGNQIAICDWEDQQVPLTGEVLDVRYASTGFMGISRRILEKISKDMPLLQKDDWMTCYPFFETRVYDGFFLSEDWDFPLLSNTSVLMPDFRWKPLGDFGIGDEVIGFSAPSANHRSYQVAKVTDVVEQIQDAYRVITTNGEIIATAKHPLLASSPSGTATRWLTVEKLHIGQRLNTPIEPFPNPNTGNTEYKAGYIKGVWQGDGAINPRGYATIEMTDKEAIIRAHKFVNELGLVAGEIRERQLNNRNWKPLWGFYCGKGIQNICNKPIDSKLIAQGFLAGIYDAEGSYRKGLLRIANKKKQIADEIELALSLIGITAKCNTRNDGLYEIQFASQKLCHQFWQSTSPAITRKISLNGQGANGYKILQSSQPMIIAIEKIGKRDVKCLTTTSGNFIADGFVSHNCEKVRKAGSRVYAHTGVWCKHIKRATIEITEGEHDNK